MLTKGIMDEYARTLRNVGVDHRFSFSHSTACEPSGRIRWTIPTGVETPGYIPLPLRGIHWPKQ
jgi:hypothetical protein